MRVLASSAGFPAEYLYSEVFDLKPTSGEILKSGIGHLKSVISYCSAKKTRLFCPSFWLYETVSAPTGIAAGARDISRRRAESPRYCSLAGASVASGGPGKRCPQTPQGLKGRNNGLISTRCPALSARRGFSTLTWGFARCASPQAVISRAFSPSAAPAHGALADGSFRVFRVFRGSSAVEIVSLQKQRNAMQCNAVRAGRRLLRK